MTWIALWVRLKVVDLVAQTAWMTLTEKLGLEHDLGGLMHYLYWGMTADGTDHEKVLGSVDRVVRADSAFTNQNKHLYRLLAYDAEPESGRPDLAGPDVSPESFISIGDLMLEKDIVFEGNEAQLRTRGDIYLFDCLIRERRPDRERGFEERLNGRLQGTAVSGLKCGEVWRLLLVAGSPDEAREKLERILVTRARREGLLMNPHYQKFEIISSALVQAKEAQR